jgi:hypothetical protein
LPQLARRQSQNSPAAQSVSALQTRQALPSAASGQVRSVLRSSRRAQVRERRPVRIAGLIISSAHRTFASGGTQQPHWAAIESASDATMDASPGLVPHGGPA